ncbi:MAG: toprim domain-containing protein, partial [Planctomycetes bacterium]|nr:toprim domain-containing protein [Planctomycetota bacterium]
YLREQGFNEIVFCLDNDASGKLAMDKIANELSSLTAKISYIELPKGINDPNEFICNGGEKEDFEALMQARKEVVDFGEEKSKPLSHDAPAPESKTQEISIESTEPKEGLIEYNDDQASFRFGSSIYQARGIKAQLSDNMRLILTLQAGGHRHIDRVDLYSDRARKGYANTAAHKCIQQSAKIDSDLIRIVEAIEERQLKEKNQKEAVGASDVVMSAADKQEALAFLKQKKLLKRIIKDIDSLGYIGQDKEKLLHYISATGRITEFPIHISIQSSSSSGKSAMMETVISLFPPESVEFFSRISGQSLYYMESLKHKVLIIDERSGAEEAEFALRSLMSRSKLSLAVVQKDEDGNCKTVVKEVEGPATVWDSTTHTITEDNRSRVFELSMDESREQTRRIHDRERDLFSPEKWDVHKNNDALMRVHHNAQRLLKPYHVEIGYRDWVGFPDTTTRMRRDFKRFLFLIAHIALLHQYQRSLKTTGGGTKYLESTADDYACAYELTKEIFESTYSQLQKDSAELVGLIYDKVRLMAEKEGLAWEDILFNRRDIREWTSWSEAKVRRCMNELAGMDYVYPIASARGRGGFRYKLTITPGELLVPLNLTHPDEIRRRLKEKDGVLSK